MPLVLIRATLELDLASKTHNVGPKSQLNTLRLEKVFWINQYFLKVSKLRNKDLSQNKMYNSFNIGDVKTVVKLKEK